MCVKNELICIENMSLEGMGMYGYRGYWDYNTFLRMDAHIY